MKPAVVVFGASGGLGRNLVEGLVADGAYEVYGTAYREAETLAATLDGLGLDPAQHAFRVDATDFAQVRACVSEIAARGPLHAIVNLVGVPAAARLASSAAEDLQRILEANVLPALWTTKALLESHKELGRKGGRVVHASSVVARRPVPGVVPYAAAKSAVEGIVRASAEEAARYEITVNALRLGYFDSGMGSLVPEALLEGIRSATAQGRLGRAADLLGAIRFLLSDDVGFVTGTTVDVDGGLF